MNDSNFCYESMTGPTKSQIKWDWLSTKPDKDMLPDTPDGFGKKAISYHTLYWVHDLFTYTILGTFWVLQKFQFHFRSNIYQYSLEVIFLQSPIK